MLLKLIHRVCILCAVLMISVFTAKSTENEYDVIIIGGGASGVSAAVQASRLGASVLLAEPTEWIGGMLTAAGVSAIDGNYNLRAGFWGEFYDELVNYYGSEEAMKTGWVSNVQFEPHVGEQILENIISQQKNVRLLRTASLVSIEKVGGLWV